MEMNEDKYNVTAIRMFYHEHRRLKQLFPKSQYAEWDELPAGCRESWILAAKERFI